MNIIQQSSNVSPSDVSPMNDYQSESYTEIIEAHQILQSGRGNFAEEQRALRIFQSIATRGCANGLYNLAVMYKDGRAGLARDSKKYINLCHQAAGQKPYLDDGSAIFRNVGVAEAENSIGMAYRDGLTVDQDNKLAFEWFVKSAQHGCPSGMNNLGVALENGTGCKQNLASARWWYQESANLGQAEARYNLALMLAEGRGGPVDTVKATELLQAAADQGLPGSLRALQKLSQSGALGARINESKKVIMQRVEKNDKEALLLLGENYMRGKGGFRTNLKQSEEYFKKASDMGHEKATVALGSLLLQQNRSEEAVFFLSKAVEWENADAQWILGRLLSLGQGCKRDVDQARRWMIRSKRETPDVISDVIEFFNEIIKFEGINGLSQEGLSCDERCERYCDSSVPDPSLRDAIKKLRKYFTPRQASPAPGLCFHDLNHEINVMAERVITGSETAKKYFVGLGLLADSYTALQGGEHSEAFHLFRKAGSTWQPLDIDALTWESFYSAATKAFRNDDRDAAALFVIMRYHQTRQLSSDAELLEMAKTCTELDPAVADYHTFLIQMYCTIGDFDSCLRAIDQARELESEPAWLYERATCLRMQGRNNPKAVIEAYQKFISSNEPDNRKVPEALYCISREYIQLMDERKAREYFEKALRAESAEVRLPCFPPIKDFPPKNQVKSMLEAMHLAADLKH
ncbi:hypothetical protein BOX15_Mlig026018g1 [Macrostomum lignano]|uniref:TPR_REGION domain-containing protein n=1 Tax=Macrostomum lignano TaxID=282301 RepID=A0A267DXL4_9PLAT|nr:hypothetical protein BOX15_Mlig026018g1 [Macrostomum lignano]